MVSYSSQDVVLETDSGLTIRSQTTIPAPIRDALKLSPGKDRIHYQVIAEGKVLISRLENEDISDPVMDKFLSFLEQDMTENPAHIVPLTPVLMQSARELISDIDIDLDAPLEGDD
ncbi:hypothetical protein AC791_04575 [Klebsiella sp. RIT-PI-d]|uniref:type II toxin-antitoxin system PrlF family antitoxin n=1 Tax=Klebsiella sp. RIT-PI-d TaxID=1681196 RepID=UPI0006768EEA|nr:type II toxin-antitoxin system PrlF family antitoxin [Klebsiella sp. RIT-PI-d]KNC11210.1 hypothetical protein AC791_04575 [Klebsiella sp. RIT-PI-d]